MQLIQQTDANKVYKLSDGHRQFAVKWIEEAHFSGVNRFHQFVLQEQLAHRGIAPQPLWLSDDGRVWVENWLSVESASGDHARVQTLANALAAVHAQPITARPLELSRRWSHYIAEAGLPASHPLVADVETLKPKIPLYDADDDNLTLCHNDLHISHILSENDLVIVDWEYSAMGNRYFDIASCIAINRLSEKESATLCNAYAELSGLDEYRVRQLVRQQVPVVDLTNKLWLTALEQHKTESEELESAG